jgi:mono/diheme cytochrome c family protein
MPQFALRRPLIALLLVVPVLVAPVSVTSVLAATKAEQRGKAYARANCARCHAIDRVSESPLRIAPPFRTLHQRYPIETLGEALAEGIYTGHADMPAFELNPDQIHDLLSYLKTLE